ncbi:MAG: argininosuccinate lyase [Peptococcaceae bacterium]|nr:argininosuccinate lyase [Peptococcaceae bacterium]
MAKLWGGRFSKDTNKLVEDFHSSISFDQKLYHWDIVGSKAHVRMLGDVGVITKEEAAQIIAGLDEILAEIENGQVVFDPAAEDIHMNIEVLLTEKIGAVGKKMHTGRSRNDQVAVDVRMYLRDEVEHTKSLLLELLTAVVDIAEEHKETVIPGYTHLQRAQPVSFAHHLLAYGEMLKRDITRLEDCQQRMDVLPLGSGALAGTTFPLDREQVAAELGFSQVCLNSMDGVSDRDFILEYMSAASISMMHLSRFCEEIILWSSQEFHFIDLDDGYSTGSSIMPQKKNPDVAELMRGKTGRVYGNLMGLLTTMKGLPLAYNKDMQEDKEGLFDTVDTWQKCLLVFTPMLRTMTVRKDNMLQAAKGGFTNATDLADYLVRKGVPFRDAHAIVGKMVAECLDRQISLDEVSLEEYQQHHPAIEEDIYEAISVYTCMAMRNTIGGPSVAQTTATIAADREFLKARLIEA